MKKVSVIIPVYNVEKYIAFAVQSVLKQSYQNFELIIVDDGSPDQSIEICQQFIDPRITIIHQKNRGVCAARNTGIRHAQGEYLAFLDGDDIWLPEKLEKHVEHLETPTVGISFSRSALIDETGQLLGTYLMPKLKELTPSCLLLDNAVGNGSAPVIRREVLEAIKFQDDLYGTREDCYFDERLHHVEDLECWLRVAIQTDWQIEGIPEALTLYRLNTSGASTKLMRQFQSWEKVREKTRSYAPMLIAQWEGPANAYQFRSLARSAVRMQSGSLAVELIHRTLAAYWQIVLEQPRRTLMTLAAAYLLWLLPQRLYYYIEVLTAKVIGARQKSRILRDRVAHSFSEAPFSERLSRRPSVALAKRSR